MDMVGLKPAREQQEGTADLLHEPVGTSIPTYPASASSFSILPPPITTITSCHPPAATSLKLPHHG